MNKTSVIHARIEPETKSLAERILHRLGLSPTEAIRMFYRQITLRRGLPFRVEIPNRLTSETLEKSQKGEELEKHDSLESMFESWNK